MPESFLFSRGTLGRGVNVDASGRLLANTDNTAPPFVYALGETGHLLSVDASGRLLVDISEGGGGLEDNAVLESHLSDEAKGLGVKDIQLVADPGDGNNIVSPTQGSFRVEVATAGAQTRILKKPGFFGQVCIIVLDTNGGDLTMTNTDGWKDGGTSDDLATFDTAQDQMVLVGIGLADEDWRVLASKGVVFS